MSLRWGLLMATMLTLLLVPAFYQIAEDARGWLQRRFSFPPARADPTRAAPARRERRRVRRLGAWGSLPGRRDRTLAHGRSECQGLLEQPAHESKDGQHRGHEHPEQCAHRRQLRLPKSVLHPIQGPLGPSNKDDIGRSGALPPPQAPRTARGLQSKRFSLS